MKIKVCGMKYSENISEVMKLPIDYIGHIFYSKSPRYVGNSDIKLFENSINNIERVGVYVNSTEREIIKSVKDCNLSVIQLHGSESSEFCGMIKDKLPFAKIIKAFNISEYSDLHNTSKYKDVCDYFLFDTKTPNYGGSGFKFDWKILDQYTGSNPFFLSGGISIDDVDKIKKISHPKLFALDLNSKFEIEPGLKNIELLKQFVNQIRNE